MEHTGSTAIEKPITPIVAHKSAVLDGVGMESAPPLRGYVKFISKPGADTILKIEPNDPLLAIMAVRARPVGGLHLGCESALGGAVGGWSGSTNSGSICFATCFRMRSQVKRASPMTMQAEI